MNKPTVKGYPLDSEGAESESELFCYEDIIEALWEVGLVGHKSTLVGLNGETTECVWVYSTALLLEKMEDKIKTALWRIPVKISTFPNREEVEIKIV